MKLQHEITGAILAGHPSPSPAAVLLAGAAVLVFIAAVSSLTKRALRRPAVRSQPPVSQPPAARPSRARLRAQYRAAEDDYWAASEQYEAAAQAEDRRAMREAWNRTAAASERVSACEAHLRNLGS